MDRDSLKDLMEGLETFRVEKTRSTTDTDKFCQAICAFSNDMPGSNKPGYLFIGVNEDGSPCGINATDRLLIELSGLRTDGNILPIPSMIVEHIPTNEGDIIVITVQPSMDPPVRYRGRCYIRTGPRKAIATRAEEDMLSERRQYSNRTFDMQPCREEGAAGGRSGKRRGDVRARVWQPEADKRQLPQVCGDHGSECGTDPRLWNRGMFSKTIFAIV